MNNLMAASKMILRQLLRVKSASYGECLFIFIHIYVIIEK